MSRTFRFINDPFLREEIVFEKGKNTDEPLLKLLWLNHECTNTTVEVLMKYYKEVTTQNNNKCIKLKRYSK